MAATVFVSIGVMAAALGIALGRYVWPAVRASNHALGHPSGRAGSASSSSNGVILSGNYLGIPDS
jgi:hypothetical protein